MAWARSYIFDWVFSKSTLKDLAKVLQRSPFYVLMSFHKVHFTTPHRHLTSPHLTSPHLTSPLTACLTSPYLHLTSPHLTSPHLTSPSNVLPPSRKVTEWWSYGLTKIQPVAKMPGFRTTGGEGMTCYFYVNVEKLPGAI